MKLSSRACVSLLRSSASFFLFLSPTFVVPSLSFLFPPFLQPHDVDAFSVLDLVSRCSLGRAERGDSCLSRLTSRSARFTILLIPEQQSIRIYVRLFLGAIVCHARTTSHFRWRGRQATLKGEEDPSIRMVGEGETRLSDERADLPHFFVCSVLVSCSFFPTFIPSCWLTGYCSARCTFFSSLPDAPFISSFSLPRSILSLRPLQYAC